MSAQSWFRHSVLYCIDVRTFASSRPAGPGDLKGIALHLDYLRRLGVDAILLKPLTPASATGIGATIDPALGTLDDFDALSLQASRRGIRILLTLSDPNPSLARFWLTRGVAGFYIPGGPDGQPVDAGSLQTIRKLLPTFVGQRILITDPDAPPPAGRMTNELTLESISLNLAQQPEQALQTRELATQLRLGLERSQLRHTALPLVSLDPSALERNLAGLIRSRSQSEVSKIIGTVLLLNRSEALLHSGQELMNQEAKNLASGGSASTISTISWGAPITVADEDPTPAPAPPPPDPKKFGAYVPYVPEKYAPYKPGSADPTGAAHPDTPDPSTVAGQEAIPGSVPNFYRHLTQLHHGRAAFRDGEEILLDHDKDSALVWIRKPAVPTVLNPPVLVICNLSAKPAFLSLGSEMARLHLKVRYLRTLLRSDAELDPMELGDMIIPAFGVYVGELRY